MIKVQNLNKEFKRFHHQKGFFGAIKNLLSRQFDVIKAVDNISFNLEKGECVGYLGPNGAGKSTTIKMLSGILVPTNGIIEVNGIVPWANRQANALQIGAVFGQRTQLWWDLPANESFDLLGKMYRIEPQRLKQQIDFFTTELEMESFLKTPVRKLSLGQKMRCELTASLLHEPPILYLDEPTIGLDLVAKEKIRRFIKYINKEFGVTVILTTHDLDDVESLCERVIVIDQGKVIKDDRLINLKKQFAGRKILNLEVKENPLLKLPLGCRYLEFNNHHWVIEFDINTIKAPELISFLSARVAIVDLIIHETPIEEVVKEIYQNEGALKD